MICRWFSSFRFHFSGFIVVLSGSSASLKLSDRNLPEILFRWLKAHAFFPSFFFFIYILSIFAPALREWEGILWWLDNRNPESVWDETPC